MCSTGKDGASQAFLLCNAVNSGDLQLLRRLLEAGYRADAADYDKRTPLHVAAAQGNLAAVSPGLMLLLLCCWVESSASMFPTSACW